MGAVIDSLSQETHLDGNNNRVRERDNCASVSALHLGGNNNNEGNYCPTKDSVSFRFVSTHHGTSLEQCLTQHSLQRTMQSNPFPKTNKQ